MFKVTALIAASFVATAAMAQAPAGGAPENTGPNKSIVRWAEGKYLYQTADGKRERGSETFRLNVHPDGTRTLIMSNDISARSNIYSVILRVAENFRPLQSYVTYWTDTGYKGSSFMTVSGNRVETLADGPTGRVTQSVAAPEKVSIGTHPVAGDGWHMWYEDPASKTEQTAGTLYSVESSSDLAKPVVGQMLPFKFTIIGKEKITVPAGTFDTVKYRIGSTDIWVLMPDRLVIRSTNTARGNDYVLTEFKSGDNAKK
ncbi:MAG: hypothetical protein FJX59_01050 [Alphaproteobacteria bacterium]|nr:hypothetical protein [Alphaproteobacteria bacterium]